MLALVQDARRFASRYCQALENWPLQIYSSAVIFSPELSIIKKENIDKVPAYLMRFPRIEEDWACQIQTLAGHSGPVNAVAFSPNGQTIASGSGDKIRLQNTTTGILQKTLAGHSADVSAVAFSPDGKQIASGSWDSTIKLWNISANCDADAPSNGLLNTLAGHTDVVNAVTFSHDGNHIASGSSDGTIKLWNIITGTLQKTLAAQVLHEVDAVAFSPDGKQIAAITSRFSDKTIELWDIPGSPKASKYLGKPFGGLFRRPRKIKSRLVIKTSELTSRLRFTACN